MYSRRSMTMLHMRRGGRGRRGGGVSTRRRRATPHHEIMHILCVQKRVLLLVFVWNIDWQLQLRGKPHSLNPKIWPRVKPRVSLA